MKINTTGFGMAKSAAQLLYGPVLVSILSQNTKIIVQDYFKKNWEEYENGFGEKDKGDC